MIVYPREEGKVLSKDAETSRFFEWASEIGVKLNPKIQYPVEFPPGYYGMQTSAEILPGEDILSAPNSAMLSMKLMNSPSLAPVYSSSPDLFSLPDRAHEDCRIITYFLWQQSLGGDSFWQPYLSFLPKTVETIIDWTDADLAQLQDPDFEYDSKYRRDRDFQGNIYLGTVLQGFPELFKAEYLTIENINWVWKILCTRSYGRCVPYNSLIPIADLINHSNVNTNYFYAVEEEKCPDFSNETLEVSQEDSDDPMFDRTKPLLISSLKLQRLSFGQYKNMTERQQEIAKEVLEQARIDDSQSFVKSN